jgi:hypothetical protein
MTPEAVQALVQRLSYPDRFAVEDEESDVLHRLLNEAASALVSLARENDTLTHGGIIEVAVRNQSVSDYMTHWEGRALKAEAEVVSLARERDEARQAAQQHWDERQREVRDLETERDEAEARGRRAGLREAAAHARAQAFDKLRDERWDAGFNRACEVCASAIDALAASGELQAAAPGPHPWTPDASKNRCLVCGDGPWGRHRFQSAAPVAASGEGEGHGE